MLRPIRLLKGQVSRTKFDVGVAQAAMFVGGVAIMMLGIRKLARLELTETELFFGVLLVMVLALQLILAGMLLPLTARGERKSG